MKIDVDRSRCAASGTCEAIAPMFFEMGDDGEVEVLGEEVDAEDTSTVDEAIEMCPTRALSLQG